MFLVCKLEEFTTKYSWFYPGDLLCPFWGEIFEAAALILGMELYELSTTSAIYRRIAVPEDQMEKLILIDLENLVSPDSIEHWKAQLEGCYGKMSIEGHGFALFEELPGIKVDYERSLEI